MSIYNLTEIDSLQAGDNIKVFDLTNGNDRKTSISALQSYMQSNLNFTDSNLNFTTQYSAPSTGETVTVTPAIGSVYLKLTPAATLATLTISLPTSPVDKQEFLVKCSQIVTTLTVSGDKTISGAPTAFTANGFFKLRYDAGLSVWDRVG